MYGIDFYRYFIRLCTSCYLLCSVVLSGTWFSIIWLVISFLHNCTVFPVTFEACCVFTKFNY